MIFRSWVIRARRPWLRGCGQIALVEREGLFSLAIMAYKDAQRQTKEGTKIPDPSERSPQD
jgi:hypothetical protein